MSTLIAQEDFASLYSAAYACYDAGDYEKADELFNALTQSAPFEEGHWRGLASTRQMLSDYEGSLHAWSIVALLNTGDPYVHFHAGECLLSLGNRQEAAKALDMAEARLNSPADDELKDKIELLKTIHMS
jgi:type III secretion system low calcium response chaperone LcrH/SycD